MNHDLKYDPTDNSSNDLSCLVDQLKRGKSRSLRITIDAIDAVDHMAWFTRQLFLANLLDIQGLFLKGPLSKEYVQKFSDLYRNTKFSFVGHWLFPNSISLSGDKLLNNELTKDIQYPSSSAFRTIICWNGEVKLSPKDTLALSFDSETILGTVAQVQKVIHTDFTGSTFGVNLLEPGQMGTILFLLEKEIEKVPYLDNHDMGFFVVMSRDQVKTLGIGIIIKE